MPFEQYIWIAESNFSLFSSISDSGLSLENGVFVAAVVPGSPAAKEGSLTVGDRIIAVSLKNPFALLNFYLLGSVIIGVTL